MAVDSIIAGAIESSLDGFAQHEVVAHQAHRLSCRGAHRWKTKAFGEQPDGSARRFAGLDHAGRHPQGPG